MASIPVLLNPRSGSRASEPEHLSELFRKAGVEAEIHPAASLEEMRALAEKLVAANAPLIVVGGGDGTVNAIASVAAGSETALGVLPLGTLNHFARDARIPLALDAAVETAVKGKPRQVDVAEVNGRMFVNNSSIGLYPAIVRRREKLRGRVGKWPAMLWAMQTVLRSHPFLDLTLELDGKPERRRTAFVFVGNNSYEMEGFSIGLRERIDCGVLSVYLTRRPRRFSLLLLALRALFGRLHQAEDFEAATTGELRIDSRHKRVLVATDGEVAPAEMPLVYRIHPRALRVVTP